MTTEAAATQPDLVVLRGGQPVIVVEVKGREIGSDFQTAVIRQLEQYATAARAEWAVLADPKRVRIYRIPTFGKAAASFASKELPVRRNGGVRVPIGEHTLLLAIERWLRELPKDKKLLSTHPALKDLVQDLVGADQYNFEYNLD